jgi:hypothetical protein
MNTNKIIYDFKKWLKAQNELNENNKMVGCTVTTNLSLKHFCEVADVLDGNLIKVGKNFIKNGGVIEQIIENQTLIKCGKNKFYININDVIES